MHDHMGRALVQPVGLLIPVELYAYVHDECICPLTAFIHQCY